jgi:hypothetical protein
MPGAADPSWPHPLLVNRIWCDDAPNGRQIPLDLYQGSAPIRASITERLGWLGVSLDPLENAAMPRGSRALTAAFPSTSCLPMKS